ncbi:hypothetical protein JAAARDRAFT_32431 [Jaapia argillacea MUCL 33604]|uniref:NAD(P)-binding protein n=1 Tax=Jaapia argillacea MUCL 33604 TaxID=933084 RepID=A0A067PZ02_9AGAM|nr:hypothetical protein JAAARDRAFT_32431 [Jaapia argillacea MUCL 33604]
MASALLPRVAIVTGASQGIGRAIALRLANDGLNVVVNDIPSKSSKVDSVVQDILAKGTVESFGFCADVSTESGVKGLIEKTVKELGAVDVMIANAGVLSQNPIIETTVEDWDRVLGINARGAFLQYKFAAQQMIKQGRGGRIIGACSVAGKSGYVGVAAYVASKHAIRGLTETAALEWGPHGIAVNAYCPGPVDTDMIRPPGYKEELGPGALLEALQLPPGGQVGTVHDIANLVSFLVRPESHFISGQAITICGWNKV